MHKLTIQSVDCRAFHAHITLQISAAKLRGNRMRVILFQSRFAPMVQSGKKTQTIRKKARCKPGDQLSLRIWTGKPYRSKQKIFLSTVCVSVKKISIGHGLLRDEIDQEGDMISIDGFLLPSKDRAVLARSDGFECATDMLEFFKQNYGLPFHGELIQWS
jgi:uncharacterized protein YqfB (UPF0267 family)